MLDPSLDRGLVGVLQIASWTVWAAFAILDVEQDATDANITSFGDALWWSAATVTTVGYGDRFPVTTEGRIIDVALMLVGIATVGAVIASVTAWVVSQVEDEQVEDEPARSTTDEDLVPAGSTTE